MSRHYIAAFILIGTSFFSSTIISAQVVDWRTNEGISRLEHARYKRKLTELASQFEGQTNKVYCGIASATIVLNALRAGKKGENIAPDSSSIAKDELGYFPKSNNWIPFWRRYTQNTVVNYSAKPKINIFGRPVTPDGKSDYGMHLADESKLLSNAGLDVTTVTVSSLNEFLKMRQGIIHALASPNQYVIINYLRTTLGQIGDGHFSPLGAYDEKTDSFLIMDVSNTEHSWGWVSSKDLFKAMNTRDGLAWRGYLIVHESASSVSK